MSIYDDDWGNVVDVPRPISREEQERRGLINVSDKHGSRYVPASIDQHGTLTAAEQGVLSQAVTAAGHLIAHRQMSHLAKSEDTAVTHAAASLLYSIPYLLVVAVITGGLFLFAFLLFEGDERFYLVLWLVVWGACALHYLTKNRELGLRHSSAGIALADIESREHLAEFVIEKHVELIEKRWASKG